jgi:2-polyprenyl-3-methyl-5-hydroxy-6-metoxy-1,4-benzoquinol methylase
MTDYRNTLYKNYVSTFKDGTGAVEPRCARIADYHKRNFISKIQNLPKNSLIIDLGCGAGQLLQSLSEAGFKNIRGIDCSPEQVARAQSNNLDVVCDDVFTYLRELEIKASAIFAIDFIEHFTKEELFTLGNQVMKNLEPGGLFIMQTPNGKSPNALRNIYGDMTHMTILSDESAEQWLKGIGFEIAETKSSEHARTSWRDYLRISIRSFLLKSQQLRLFFITGRKESSLGENLLVVARKASYT